MADKQLSGRDLRDAVALRVMGWTLADRRAMGWSPGPDVWLTGDVENPTEQDWWPTESIEAAFQVVQKMYEAEWAAEIHRSIVIDDDWLVEFTRPNGTGVKRGSSIAKSLPLAICRAALACIEGSKG